MAKTAAEFVEGMDDPDRVGQSEYRMLHELLSDIADGDGSEDEDVGLASLEGALDEVIGWAEALRRDIRKAKK